MVRIIPRLDIKGPNLVKWIHLEWLRVLWNPNDFAKFYYENWADELMYMDIVASLYERNSLDTLISKASKEIFIPITVWGWIRSLEDINTVLRAWADKVSLNTAAIRNPKIISEASRKFWSSTIVVSIEAIKQPDWNYLAYIDNWREFTWKEVKAWANEVESLWCWEIVITSVDREWTWEGFDTELIEKISSSVSVPVIAHWGCKDEDDALKAVSETWANWLAISSVLHYDCIKNCSFDKKNEDEGNTSFLEKNISYSKIQTTNIQNIKNHLIENNFNCRKI